MIGIKVGKILKTQLSTRKGQFEVKLYKANEDNKQCGWTLCPSFLTIIQNELIDLDDCPSLEQTEMILLSFKKFNENSK